MRARRSGFRSRVHVTHQADRTGSGEHHLTRGFILCDPGPTSAGTCERASKKGLFRVSLHWISHGPLDEDGTPVVTDQVAVPRLTITGGRHRRSVVDLLDEMRQCQSVRACIDLALTDAYGEEEEAVAWLTCFEAMFGRYKHVRLMATTWRSSASTCAVTR